MHYVNMIVVYITIIYYVVVFFIAYYIYYYINYIQYTVCKKKSIKNPLCEVSRQIIFFWFFW